MGNKNYGFGKSRIKNRQFTEEEKIEIKANFLDGIPKYELSTIYRATAYKINQVLRSII